MAERGISEQVVERVLAAPRRRVSRGVPLDGIDAGDAILIREAIRRVGQVAIA